MDEPTELQMGMWLQSLLTWVERHEAVKDYTDKRIEKLITKQIKDKVQIEQLEIKLESAHNRIDMLKFEKRNDAVEKRLSKILERIEKLIWDSNKGFTYKEVYEALYGEKKND